jgi:hypothetical protein
MFPPGRLRLETIAVAIGSYSTAIITIGTAADASHAPSNEVRLPPATITSAFDRTSAVGEP